MIGNPYIKKSARFVLPIAIIVVMMFWLTGAFSKDRIEPAKLDVKMRPAAGVPTCSVVAVMTPVVSEAAGTIQPEYRMTVSSRISANILEMRVRAGQHVQKDELLARLDSRDITSRSAQAKETLRRAQATRDLAASDYQRDKPLMDKAVIPRSEFDQTDMRLRTAEADVQRAREALREADVSLSYAEIRSPATGVVIDKLADVGDLATPGKALLNMYEQGRLWLEANVREQEASSLRIGESYAIRIAATGETMDGKLVEIVPSMDPTSRTVISRITLPRTSGLYPGMFGRLSIPIHQTKRILVPDNVIIRIGQLTLVDVVVGDQIKRRAIQTGGRMGDQVEILSGLAGGEKVVCALSQAGTP
ncbi:MAG: efflux RND transporter periplasmic adaptor subunit [Deltaproteobacteria bacterium]|nr:efflux RND transporter periplasmic adaptor subunit [Deltaproteobacteria bacterium]